MFVAIKFINQPVMNDIFKDVLKSRQKINALIVGGVKDE